MNGFRLVNTFFPRSGPSTLHGVSGLFFSLDEIEVKIHILLILYFGSICITVMTFSNV